jgi:peroxiredoxin
MELSRRLLLGSLSAGALLAQAPPAKTHLKVGDPAPDFAFKSTSAGQPFKLSDFKGKKSVVVAFFPAAFTGG